MSNKSFLKIIVAFGVLAALLIFLGVNYVPRISASTTTKANEVAAAKISRADYLDEQFPRAIVSQRSSTGSDFLNHHPFAVSQSLTYTGADFLNHHPFAVSQQLKYAGSDFFERHPSIAAPYLLYAGSDWIERHPSSVFQSAKYTGSDWIERHPSNDFSIRVLIEAKSEK